MKQTNIKTVLIDIGLSQNEAAILISLFRNNSMKVSDLAYESALNRTTIYGVLKTLSKRGLVSSFTRYGIVEYKAIDPSLLLNYIDRQKEELNNKKKKIENLLPEIKKLHTLNNVLPAVNFFEGIEGVKQAYEDTLKNNQEKKTYVFSGPDAVFKELGKEYVNYYVNKRKELNITCYQIAGTTNTSKAVQNLDKKSLRITKLIPKEFAFDTEIIAYDNRVAFISLSHNKLVAMIITDEAISNTIKKLFSFTNNLK